MATDYAIIALGYLSHQEPGRNVCAKEISEGYRIPPELLAKILQKLAKAGLINSFPGPTGGYALARAPKDITVADVVQTLEGQTHLVKCLNDDLECIVAGTCDIVEPMRLIHARVQEVLQKTTLEEIQRNCRKPDTPVGASSR